jgi:hypothetical protein
VNPKKTESPYQNRGTFETDIKMEFHSDKCLTLNIRCRKVALEGLKTRQENIIEPMNETGTYKYTGIPQSRQFQHTKNKKQVTPAITD